MKRFLLTHAFIISLTTQSLFSMNSKLQQEQKKLEQDIENLKQIMHDKQKAIQEELAILEKQVQANKRLEQAALKAHRDIIMFNWIVGSGIVIVIIGCILYSYSENEALKNAQRYRRIKTVV